MGLQANLRAASIAMFKAYAASVGLRANWYEARPGSISPPHFFVDAMNERVTYDGLRQRFPVAELIVVWGLFDSKVAADQRDAFVDGFLDWWTDNVHAAGSNTVSGVSGFEDIPDYTPNWTEKQTTYYATRITVEGYSG